MMKFFKCDNEGIVIPVTKVFTNEDCICNAKEISPNTVEADPEKHSPVVSICEKTVTVNVGNVVHPMTQEHSIMSVFLETQHGGQFKFLPHDSNPVVHFEMAKDDKAIAAYAYCNLHGLWKVDID